MIAAGLIFSNIHDSRVPELTGMRTIASVPFGCRYRLIDFVLSEYVNSGITNIGIVTHCNYQSLLDHIGNGKDWDLARRSGGIKILPPFIAAYDSGNALRGIYKTRLEALIGAMNFISRCKEEYIVISDCDAICNIDIGEVLRYHRTCGSDVTLVTKRFVISENCAYDDLYKVYADENNRIKGIYGCMPGTDENDEVDICTNVIIMKNSLLRKLINESAAYGYSNFYRDLIAENIGRYKFTVYRYDGFYKTISSLQSYFECSMQMLDGNIRNSLFGIEDRPVFTKVRNSAPTSYAHGAKVRNSLIADGCNISGTVENSIIFRGVDIGRNAKVKDCILLQGTHVGKNAQLCCVVADKNAFIKQERTLGGYRTVPYFIGKGVII